MVLPLPNGIVSLNSAELAVIKAGTVCANTCVFSAELAI